METIFLNTAASADIYFLTIPDLRLHPVVNLIVSVNGGDTVANGISVGGITAAHIPAVGQSEADRQHIAVLEINCGHGLAGIVIPAANAVHPAGAAGVIKFTKGATGTGTLIQAVSPDTAPQGCQATSLSKDPVDFFQTFLFRISRPSTAFQRICRIP